MGLMGPTDRDALPSPDAGFEGFAPEIAVQSGNPEALKYGKIWQHPEYRKIAPGEQLAQVFLAQARPKTGASVIDFGCGTGRGALMLAVLGGLNVTMVDFVRNSLDDDVRAMLDTQAHVLRFVKADLEKPLPVAAEYGFCTDVLEHIPPAKVEAVLNNVLRAAQHVFFSISTVDDSCGQLIGEPLHLSVHPYPWWLAQFNARDCVVHWSKETPGAALFYVTAWQDGAALVAAGALNIAEEQVKVNVRANTGPHRVDTMMTDPTGICMHEGSCERAGHAAALALLHRAGAAYTEGRSDLLDLTLRNVEAVTFGPFEAVHEAEENRADGVRVGYWWGNSNRYWPFSLAEWESAVPRWAQVTPHETNDAEVMILGGGPSIAAFEDDIRAKRADGIKVVTLNGAYKWALDRDLGPVTQIMVDARPFNARFVQPIDPKNLYLIASQCDPSVLEGLPKDRTLLWHTSTELIKEILTEAYPGGWWSIPGGSTVLLRAIPLLRMLGFRKFHLFGCDSCLGDEERHHAYAQPENDGALVMNVTVGGRVFQCAPWMASQATEFLDLVKFLGEEIELEVHGDGLLSWTLEYAAQLQADREMTLP